MSRFRRVTSLFAGLLVAGMLMACGSSYGGSTLTGITIAPISPSIAVGATQLFTATGHFSNGPDQDLTHQANWTSSVPSVASVAGTGVEPSLATGVAQGTTQITVSFAQGSSTSRRRRI